jgi:hypothetical protein
MLKNTLERFRTVIERLGTLKDAEGTLDSEERLETKGGRDGFRKNRDGDGDGDEMVKGWHNWFLKLKAVSVSFIKVNFKQMFEFIFLGTLN